MTRGLGYGYGRDSDVRSDTQVVVPPDPGQDYESRHMDVREEEVRGGKRREEEATKEPTDPVHTKNERDTKKTHH